MSSRVNGSTAWRQDFSSAGDEKTNGYTYIPVAPDGRVPGQIGDWRFQVAEFGRGAMEMSVEFGKGIRDVLKQSVLRDDSFIMRKCKGPCAKIVEKLKFLNEYLPEDRDPVHVWSIISFVLIITLAVLLVNTNPSSTTTTPLIRTMKTHPANATLILLPDGRRLAYQEQGVPANQARYSMILPHSFLSSRLAGIPGLKGSLLQEFGVRLVTYDLPGFGESDAHPHRDLESSAMDMFHLSFALGITDKFWVVGYSGGSMHAWAALRYIPDRLAGAIMVSPMVNPYEQRLNKEEKRAIWGKWTTRKRMMYHLARKFPKLLAYFYHRSFLSGNHGQIDTFLSFSLGKKDKAVVENKQFEEFWQRDVEESVRQANVKPFLEEAILQVSNWGFTISDLKAQNKHRSKSIFRWLKRVYNPVEERLSGFVGPIHIWQGGEDMLVPPSMSEFVYRVLPDVMLHKLPYEGHFTYFYFCDECHRQMFTTVYGNPQGPLEVHSNMYPISIQDDGEENRDIHTATDNESSSLA